MYLYMLANPCLRPMLFYSSHIDYAWCQESFTHFFFLFLHGRNHAVLRKQIQRLLEFLLSIWWAVANVVFLWCRLEKVKRWFWIIISVSNIDEYICMYSWVNVLLILNGNGRKKYDERTIHIMITSIYLWKSIMNWIENWWVTCSGMTDNRFSSRRSISCRWFILLATNIES